MDETGIGRLVDSEFASFQIDGVLEWAQQWLVPPESQLRNWDYGPSGQKFECWLIAVRDKSGIVWSDKGHADPWGVVRLDDSWLGPDSYWFSRLEDAFIASGWSGPLPQGYEVS